MPWYELSVEAAREAVDWVRMSVATSGMNADRMVVEPLTPDLDATAASAWEYLIRLYVAPNESVDAAASKLEQALGSLLRAGLVSDLYVERIPERPAALDRGRAEPQRVGTRFVVLTTDQEAATQPDDLVLRMAPTRAFGTGHHPATHLSLRLLERHAVAGMETLDLGCGSGILSIALARLGARVLALDNDPVAVQETGENVVLNGLGAQVRVAAGSLGSGNRMGHWTGGTKANAAPTSEEPATFDLIVANILARIHVALAPDYWRALRPGGLLITAGYMSEREQEIALRFAEEGFAQIDRAQDGEFVAMVHRRRTTNDE